MPNADTAWFPDNRITPWIASEVTDFYHQSSYGRLDLTPLRIHPGVVRIPKLAGQQYPPNAYQYLDLIKPVVTTGSNAVPNGINAATDLVIMMWAQCEDSWLQVLYPTPQLSGCDDGSCWSPLLTTLATQHGVSNDKVKMMEGGNGYFVYYVLTSQLSTTKAIANEIKDSSSAKHTAVLTKMSTLTSTTVTSFNGNRQESKCSTTPAEIVSLSWAGQASPTFNGNPPVFAINGFSGCEDCISGLMQHELSHALGNAPHPGAYVPPVGETKLPVDMQVAYCTSSVTANCMYMSYDLYSATSWPSVNQGSQNNMPEKWNWGFINDEETTIVAASDTNPIYRRLLGSDLGTGVLNMAGSTLGETVPPKSLGIAIQSASTVGTSNELYLWLSFRPGYQNSWNDATYSKAAQLALRRKGAILHVGMGPVTPKTKVPMLIDATPETDHSKYTSNKAVPAMVNCPLTVGKTFADAYHSIYVRTLCVSNASLSHPYIDVAIRRTPFPAGSPSETAVCTDAVPGAINCQGSFGTCTNLCKKTFTITRGKQGAGDACSHATGAVDSCVGGDCVVKPSNPDPGKTKDECFTDCNDDVVGESGSKSGETGGKTGGNDPTPSGASQTTGTGTKAATGGQGGGGGDAGLIVGLTFLFLLLILVVVLVLFVKRKKDRNEPLPKWLQWTNGIGSKAGSGHSKHASVLPPGWSKHNDSETGKDYFVNEITEMSTFDRPGSIRRPPSTNDAYAHNPMSRRKESDTQRLSHADSLGVIEMTKPADGSTDKNPKARKRTLPVGWEVGYDTDGTVYYYHEETELSQWDFPK